MKRKFTILTAVLLLLTMIHLPGNAVGQSTFTIGWGTASGDAGTYQNFTDVEGTVQDVLSFSTATNSSSNVPAYNSGSKELRLYFHSSGDGNSIIIEPAQDVTITGAVVTASSTSYTPPVNYFVDGGSAVSGTWSSTTLTISNISASSSLEIKNVKTSTSTQLRIKTIALTYTISSSSSVATPVLSKGTSYCDEDQSITITCDTEGAAIHYTLDGSEPTSSSATYSGAISITETTTLRAIAILGEESSSEASATYTFVSTLKTLEAVYNAATTAGSTATSVYIHFNNWVISGNNNGTPSTLAYLTDGTNGCEIYYNTDNTGHGFVAGNVLNGIASCSLKLQYGMAYITGLTASSFGLEITDEGSITPVVTTIDALSGINSGSVVTLNGLTWNGSVLSDGTNTIKNSNQISTQTLTTGYTYDITGVLDYDYSVSKRINPRSAADVVKGPATLPFNWAGGGKSDLMALQGVTANGLGSDYSSSTHGVYIVRMDDTGDYIIVRTDSQPDVVTIGVKMIGGNTTSHIAIQASADGVTFDDGEELEISGSQNAIVNLESTRTFDANVRYVKMLFTKGANIGVGPISITKYTTDPLITVSPSSITDFSYSVGDGPSTVKSFTVGGSNLGSTTISIAFGTGTNFEMALAEDAATWSSSVSLTPTDGTVSDTPVYVRMKAGLEEGTYTDNVSATWGSLSETVSLSGTVNPAPVTYTYTAASSITPGKRYVIVGFADSEWEQPYAMAEQKTNNRGAISVASYYDSEEDEFSIPSNAGVYEFVISGDETNLYSVYDTENNGYLYATSGSNNLNQKAALTVAGKWTITNGGDNDNMVVSVSFNNNNTETRKMRFNYASNNQLFSCYTGGQKDIYLYERTDNNCDIYSATNIDSDMTVAGDMNIHAGVVTVKEDAVLTVNGSLTNTNPANLTIEDGAQLVTDDVVEATIQKNINAYTVIANDDTDPDNVVMSNGWYFISYPLNCDNDGDAPTEVTNMIANPATNYDLYKLVDNTWANYKQNEDETNIDPSFTLYTGHGYLYANANDVTLEFAGSLNYFGDEFSSLEIGWNLVGNPYTYSAYPSMPYYKMNEDGTAIESVESTGAITPCTGILVYNDEEDGPNEITYSKTAPTQNAVNHGNVQMVLAQTLTTRGESGSKTLDNAIVNFNEGIQLPKFYFGTQNANLYIPQGNKEYAIVNTEAQGEMPVNFKANEDGQYTLTVNPEGVEMGYLHLIDNMTGADIDLLATPSYSFEAKTTDYESRFRLVFAANNEDGVSTGSTTFAFFSNGSWIINNEGEATLQVIDLNGRILSSETINGSVSTSINATTGIYMVRLISGDNVKTQKVVVR